MKTQLLVLPCGLIRLLATLFLSIQSVTASLSDNQHQHHQNASNHNSTLTPSRQLLDTSSRIVGGSAVALGTYPGFVYWNQGCGGTLITRQIVLTAAHCVSQCYGSLSHYLCAAVV